MERGSVEANFSLHGCKTANFTYFKKRFRRAVNVFCCNIYHIHIHESKIYGERQCRGKL